MKETLKGAVILLITITMVFSSVAVANTKTRQQCNPSIDIEKEVWDERNGIWVDADTEYEAFDVAKCSEINFRVTVTNTGDCPIHSIDVWDVMHISLKFISVDPTPDREFYEDEWYIMYWFVPVMYPTEVLQFYITAHVEGEECNYSVNMADAGGWCYHGIPVDDEDDCWIHSIKNSRTFNGPLLNFLQDHPNLFPLLQKLIQQLGFGI